MNIPAAVSSVMKLMVASLVALSVAGCGEGTPVGAELRLAGLQVGEVARAVQSPAPYQAGVYQREIGPEGGTLHFGVGSLSFPRGALAEPTLITAEVDGYTVGAEFGPEGLQFPAQAQPTLRFRLTSGGGLYGGVLYVDNRSVILDILDADFDQASSTVQADLSHFSKYIFGAN